MAIILIYFALFVGVHFTAKAFRKSGQAKLFQIVSCFVLLFLFFGFRDITVLNDTPHYYGAYYQLTRIRSYMESSVFTFRLMLNYEYGFQVFQHILAKYVSKEPFTIIIASSLIISWGNVRFLSRQTRHMALALFMLLISGILFDQYCLIRQSIALMFFYAAYPYLQQERMKPYVGLIILGAFFHMSILVLLILPLMQRIPITRKHVVMVLGTAVVISLLVYEMFRLIGLSEWKYFVMNMKRDTFPVAAVLDGSMMLALILCCKFIYHKTGMRQLDKTIFWTAIFGLCVCIITPSFLSFFRLNIFIWPFIYITFFRYTTGNAEEMGMEKPHTTLRKQILLAALILLLVRIIIILTFRNEWYHLIPYSLYDFSDRFHNFDMYWEK